MAAEEKPGVDVDDYGLLPDETLCASCYGTIKEADLVASPCTHNPEAYAGAPIGMYHCPGCGVMVLAGAAHPQVCSRCAAQIRHDLGLDNSETGT